MPPKCIAIGKACHENSGKKCCDRMICKPVGNGKDKAKRSLCFPRNVGKYLSYSSDYVKVLRIYGDADNCISEPFQPLAAREAAPEPDANPEAAPQVDGGKPKPLPKCIPRFGICHRGDAAKCCDGGICKPSRGTQRLFCFPKGLGMFCLMKCGF